MTSNPNHSESPTPPGPPAPTGDDFIDEVRDLKWSASARFDHDLDRIVAHLREIEAEHRSRVVRPTDGLRRAG